MTDRLVVVTASTDLPRAQPCLDSWGDVPTIIVANRRGAHAGISQDARYTTLYAEDYLGTVPAFRRGVDWALAHTDAEIVACLHDDVELHDPDWGEKVIRLFDRRADCGLAGFGGAIGLGSSQIYQVPYDPMQLARIGFRSNLVDAEVHGARSLLSERVACLDGFSQIGRRQFLEGELRTTGRTTRPWTLLDDAGIVHHAYDSALGCLAARQGWETWYLPVRCRHLGGQTAVGDPGYHAWATQQIPQGDQGFWQQAHKRVYETFVDILPLRI